MYIYTHVNIQDCEIHCTCTCSCGMQCFAQDMQSGGQILTYIFNAVYPAYTCTCTYM